MPSILLLDIEREIAAQLRAVLAPEGYTVDELPSGWAGTFVPDTRYDLLFCEPCFQDAARIAAIDGLKVLLKGCLVVFVLKAFDKELARQCYKMGDGFIVFPVEPEKLRRIMAWYVSSEHMKEAEQIQEAHARAVPVFREALREHRVFIAALILAVLVLGAVIGIFFADQPDTRQGQDRTPLDRIKGALYELRQ